MELEQILWNSAEGAPTPRSTSRVQALLALFPVPETRGEVLLVRGFGSRNTVCYDVMVYSALETG